MIRRPPRSTLFPSTPLSRSQTADGVGDTEVGDDDAGAAVAREHVDGGAAAQEILHHLGGHRRRIRAHAFGRHTVVGREREDHGLRHVRRRAGQRGEPRGQLLETAKAARRLRHRVESASGVARGLGCRGGDGITERGDGDHVRTSFTLSGTPATISTTRSAAAAMRWLTKPSRSRKRRPSSVAGWTPSPTSLETSVTSAGWSASSAPSPAACLRMWSSGSPRSRRLATHTVRQSTTTASASVHASRSRGTRSYGSSSVRQGPGRSARWRSLRWAMSPSRAWAVATNVTRARGRWQSTAKRLLPLRAPPRTGAVDATPGAPREDRVEKCARGQVSWLSDRPTPRAFPASRPVALAGFVPDYSDGVAADSHRLPWGPRGRPGANNAGTVTGTGRRRKPRARAECPGAPRLRPGAPSAGASTRDPAF